MALLQKMQWIQEREHFHGGGEAHMHYMLDLRAMDMALLV